MKRWRQSIGRPLRRYMIRGALQNGKVEKGGKKETGPVEKRL